MARTLDEEIQCHRESAERARTLINSYELVQKSYDAHFDKLKYEKCAEEHEQLAEWLELLKWYEQGMENIPSESGVLPKDVYWAGYNKAIDDAKDVILQTIDNEILVDTLNLRLEQLKVGVDNE